MIKKYTLLLLPFLLILLLSSCKEKQHSEYQEAHLDSLANHCYDLVVQLQTDTLRMAAENYMNETQLYSQRYFKARQYYINSFFNAKEYDKVLSMLDETSKLPHFNDYPLIVCEYQYTRARCLQYSQRYPEAINAFKVCITFDTKDKQAQDLAQMTIIAAMTQLMNTYITYGKAEEGYHYFKSLREKPTAIIRRTTLRDLYTRLSYLAIQSGHIDESYHIADSIFVLPSYRSTPERLYLDYAYASVVFYNHPDAQQKVIHWLQQAIQEAEKYDNTTSVEWSLDMLAAYYLKLCRIEDATDLQYKAIRMAEKKGNKISICNIYCSLCANYIDWQLYSQANIYANLAINIIKTTDDNHFKSVAYSKKADVMESMDLPDSAFYYYKKAEKYATNPIKIGEIQNNIAEQLIEHHSGDSLALGIRIASDVLKASSKDINRSYNFYVLGKGLIKQNHTREGEIMFDSMYKDMLRNPYLSYKDGVLEYIIDHYLRVGNQIKVAQYTAQYRRKIDVRYNEKISRKVATAMIQYQTEKKEQQFKLVTAELSIKELSIQLYVTLVIVLLLLLLGGLLWYLHKRKLNRNRQQLIEQERIIALRERELIEIRMREQELQLSNALEHLHDVNHQSEQISKQLDEFLSDRENLQKIASLTPSLFRQEGEIKFRRYFTQLYAGFLPKLKEIFPTVSRSEEILCMLIALDQNMDQISDILCIEKKSVKMARYRLRKKMRLEQEESLDALIHTLTNH